MTEKTKSLIASDKDSVITEIEIAAPPIRVFEALTIREQALQWGGGDAFEVTHWEMDARAGGKWRFISKERQEAGVGKVYEHEGEILQFNPPALLEYTWYANWHPNPAHRTVVRYDIAPTKAGSNLKVTHSGLAQLAGVAEGYAQGWPGLIEQVKNFVETLASK
jgi:uncharacterized protein YndB with AHSA1/START domain